MPNARTVHEDSGAYGVTTSMEVEAVTHTIQWLAPQRDTQVTHAMFHRPATPPPLLPSTLPDLLSVMLGAGRGGGDIYDTYHTILSDLVQETSDSRIL